MRYDDGSVLGVNQVTGEPVVLSDTDAGFHTLVMGGPMSGKTTAMLNVVENAVRRGIPVIYVDGRGGDTADRVERFTREQGVPFLHFSMLPDSDAYHPLSSGRHALIQEGLVDLRSWSDDRRCEIDHYFQTVFHVLEACEVPIDLFHVGRHLSVGKLYRLVREKNQEALMPLIQTLENPHPELQTFLLEIRLLMDGEIGDLFNGQHKTRVIDLSQPRLPGGVTYFSLNPLISTARVEILGKLIVNDINALIAHRRLQGHTQPLCVVFDEFSLFAGEQMVRLLTQGREAGVYAVLSAQSFSQITQSSSYTVLGQVLDNTSNYLIQGQSYPPYAKVLVNVLGAKTQMTVTSRLNGHPTHVGSVRRTRLFRGHLTEITRLRNGETIVVNKRQLDMQKIQIHQGEI